MKKSEKIINEQVAFFEMIKKLPRNKSLVHEISDMLNISEDAAYRRINGTTPIDLEVTLKLCRHYNISIDSLIDIIPANRYILSSFVSYDYNNLNNYSTYAQTMSDEIEKMTKMHEKEIILSAADIPAFHFLAYNELTYFHLYKWNKSMLNFKGNFEDFIEEIDLYKPLDNYKKIVNNYQLIPSTEIWTNNTIDSTLQMLNYHFVMGHFNNKEYPLLICAQLLELIDSLYDKIKIDRKESKIPYNFYISEICIGNTFILFKKGKISQTLMRLYTINGLSISDSLFCKYTEDWLYNLIKHSTLISGTSEMVGFLFINAQRKKVKDLMNKIKS